MSQVVEFKPPPRWQSSWGQHGAHLGPVGPRWAPCWPHESCYQGCCLLVGSNPPMSESKTGTLMAPKIWTINFINITVWDVIICAKLRWQLRLTNIDWLVPKRRNSSALAMELRLSCTNPSIYELSHSTKYYVCNYLSLLWSLFPLTHNENTGFYLRGWQSMKFWRLCVTYPFLCCMNNGVCWWGPIWPFNTLCKWQHIYKCRQIVKNVTKTVCVAKQ